MIDCLEWVCGSSGCFVDSPHSLWAAGATLYWQHTIHYTLLLVELSSPS